MALLTPGQAVDSWAQATPRRPALTDDRRSLNWDEVAHASRKIAQGLRLRSVQQGDIVALALPNSADLFLVALAALRIGAVPLPISPKLTDVERNAVIEVARAKLVVRTEDTLLRADCAAFEGDVLAPYLKASMSGGSTGRPKIILSKQPVRFDPAGAFFPIPLGGTHLVAAPCSNSGPFTLGLLAFLRGTHLVIEPKFDAERTLAQIERHHIDFVFLVPTMMARILGLPDATRMNCDLSSLVSVAHAGEKCGEAVKRDWIDWLGPDRVQEFYAGTEAQGSTWIGGREWLSHPGSVGRPSAGCEIRIRNASGGDCEVGEVGEIFMRPAGGAGSTYAYLGAEPNRSDDGFESIGDLGHFDEQGYLYIADRRHDLILRGGTNIYPAEVELALEELVGVHAAVVIGLPDADLGQSVHAIVECGPDISETALRGHLETRLSPHKRPSSYEFVSYPLRDEGGKVRRSQYLQDRLAASGGTS